MSDVKKPKRRLVFSNLPPHLLSIATARLLRQQPVQSVAEDGDDDEPDPDGGESMPLPIAAVLLLAVLSIGCDSQPTAPDEPEPAPVEWTPSQHYEQPDTAIRRGEAR